MKNLAEVEKKSKSERAFEVASKWIPTIAVVLFVFACSLYFVRFNGWSDFVSSNFSTNEHFGSFGDFIGGLLNPILTFGTVLLLIYSIKFQVDELKATKDEMASGNLQLKRSAKFSEYSLSVESFSGELITAKEILINIFEKKIPVFFKRTNDKKAEQFNKKFGFQTLKQFTKIDSVAMISTYEPHSYGQDLYESLDMVEGFINYLSILLDEIQKSDIEPSYFRFRVFAFSSELRPFRQFLTIAWKEGVFKNQPEILDKVNKLIGQIQALDKHIIKIIEAKSNR